MKNGDVLDATQVLKKIRHWLCVLQIRKCYFIERKDIYVSPITSELISVGF